MLTNPGPMISEEEADKVSKEITDHIETEKEMIENVESILDKGVENKAIDFLLRSILKDEYYHHALLKRVYEMVARYPPM